MLKQSLFIVLGSSILSFGCFNFNYQNNITEGGVLGLILIFKNVFDISPSLTSIILDFSLFLIGSKFFGKIFLFKCILSTTAFSITYNIWENIGYLIPNLSNSMFLASILSGIFVGIGVGIVVSNGGASGGDDVIAIIGHKFTKLDVSKIYLITDGIVLTLSLVYLNFNQIIFSIIAVFISGNIIGVFHKTFKKSV